jgi:hypothetical protein
MAGTAASVSIGHPLKLSVERFVRLEMGRMPSSVISLLNSDRDLR